MYSLIYTLPQNIQKGMTYGCYSPGGLYLGKNPPCVLRSLTNYCRSLQHVHPLVESLNGGSHESLLAVLTHRQRGNMRYPD